MAFRCFVTGTDTDVGKTVVAAGLLVGLAERGPCRYWKPVQSGTDENDDTSIVRALTELPTAHFETPVYRFRSPESPHRAAAKEGVTIDRDRLLEAARRVLAVPGSLLVEGAGGLFVPLAPGFLFADLVAAMGLPVLIVAHDKLGAINHTLLTLEACRRRGIVVAGVVLNRSTHFEGNGSAIEAYGDVHILGRFAEATSAREAMRAVAAEATGVARTLS